MNIRIEDIQKQCTFLLHCDYINNAPSKKHTEPNMPNANKIYFKTVDGTTNVNAMDNLKEAANKVNKT
jgi:hypothetical protein